MTPMLSEAEWRVCAAYIVAGTGRPMSKEQAAVYYDCLNDLPVDVLKHACRRAVQECDQNWLPAVGMIRKHASEAVNGLLPQFGPEWEAVLIAVRRFGHVRKAEAMATLSPLAQQAVRSVGWDAICDSENISIQSAQFRMAYEAAAKREADMRRISPELRPVITGGELVTPKLHQPQPDAIRKAIEDTARKLTPPEEGAA